MELPWSIRELIQSDKFVCGFAIDKIARFDESFQTIVLNQRLTCKDSMEQQYYSYNQFQIILICWECACDLDDDAIHRFNDDKKKFHTVLPDSPCMWYVWEESAVGHQATQEVHYPSNHTL